LFIKYVTVPQSKVNFGAWQIDCTKVAFTPIYRSYIFIDPCIFSWCLLYRIGCKV